MPMYERDFVRSSIKAPGIPPQPAYEFTCSKCGSQDKLSLGNKHKGIPLALVKQRMQARGWEIGNRASGDICPHCIEEKAKKHLKEKTKESVVETFIKAEKPLEMTREDRRLIFAKLNEVYIDERVGYDAGWSDKKVADDLGVAVAWVKNIREENFGEEQSNEKTLQQLEDAQRCLTESREVHDKIKASMQYIMNTVEAAYNAINEAKKEFSDCKVKLASVNHEIMRQQNTVDDIRKLMGK